MRNAALVGSVLLVATACAAPDPIDLEASAEARSSADGVCKKKVYVHVANYNYFDKPAATDGTEGPNGCWGMERRIASGAGTRWTMCSYEQASPVQAWGDDPDGRWAYDETRYSHTDKGDEGAWIDKCWSTIAEQTGTKPPDGTIYMVYGGCPLGGACDVHWRATEAAHIERRFAELYGDGMYPFWSAWKEHPIGRPMVNMTPDNKYARQAYEVVKNVCEYIDSGTWMGIYSFRDTRNGTVRMNEIIQALNDCTGPKGPIGNDAQPIDDGGDGAPPACGEGAKECVDGDRYIECAGGSWSGAYSCEGSWPGTVCSQGYCVYP